MQNIVDGSFVGILNIIVGVLVVILGSYFTFIVKAIQRENDKTNSNNEKRFDWIDGSIKTLESDCKCFGKQIENIKGSLGL